MGTKIEIKICIGTACYVMGASQLLHPEEYLGEDLLSKVELSASPCLNYCRKINGSKPPYAMVGKVLVSEATPDKIRKILRKEIFYPGG